MSSVIRLIHASIATKPLRARKTSLWFIWPVVLLATANLLAQQQTQDLGEASLEELANITVYTASRHIQKVGSVLIWLLAAFLFCIPKASASPKLVKSVVVGEGE